MVWFSSVSGFEFSSTNYFDWMSECFFDVVYLYRRLQVAKFLVPGWGDKVNSGIGLSYRGPPCYTGWRAGTITAYAGVNFIPQSGTKNFAEGLI